MRSRVNAIVPLLLLQGSLRSEPQAHRSSGVHLTLGTSTSHTTSIPATNRILTRPRFNLEFEKAGALGEVDHFIQKARKEADILSEVMAEALKRRRGKYSGPFRYRYHEYSTPLRYPPWYYDKALAVDIPASLEMKEPRGPHDVVFAHEVHTMPDKRGPSEAGGEHARVA